MVLKIKGYFVRSLMKTQQNTTIIKQSNFLEFRTQILCAVGLCYQTVIRYILP
jgi:hypothetical protein